MKKDILIPKSKTVKRKENQMIIGKQNYINQATGEIIETTIIQKSMNSDFNFHKIWLTDILHILDNFGNKKIKIIAFLLKEMRNEDNSISVNYRYISEQTSISLSTVAYTMKELLKNNIIVFKRQGLYMFNPDLIIKGGSNKHMNLMIEYRQELEITNQELEKVIELKSKKNDNIN